MFKQVPSCGCDGQQRTHIRCVRVTTLGRCRRRTRSWRTRRSATLTATNQAMAPRPKTAPIISPSGDRMVKSPAAPLRTPIPAVTQSLSAGVLGLTLLQSFAVREEGGRLSFDIEFPETGGLPLVNGRPLPFQQFIR